MVSKLTLEEIKEGIALCYLCEDCDTTLGCLECGTTHKGIRYGEPWEAEYDAKD